MIQIESAEPRLTGWDCKIKVQSDGMHTTRELQGTTTLYGTVQDLRQFEIIASKVDQKNAPPPQKKKKKKKKKKTTKITNKTKKTNITKQQQPQKKQKQKQKKKNLKGSS